MSHSVQGSFYRVRHVDLHNLLVRFRTEILCVADPVSLKANHILTSCSVVSPSLIVLIDTGAVVCEGFIG